MTHSKFLKDQNKGYEEVLEGKEYHEVMVFYRNRFWWKTGNYSIKFYANSSSKCKTDSIKYAFSLSSRDIEELNKNIDHIKRTYEIVVKGGEEYQITDSILEILKTKGVSEPVINQISSLSSGEPQTRSEFLSTLESTFYSDNDELKELKKYMGIILKTTKSEDLESVNSKLYWTNVEINMLE